MSRLTTKMNQGDNSVHIRNGNAQKTVHATIKGRVQGVFYRKWTVENALKLGLRGWVRNRKDGSVEAVFSGPEKAVDHMLFKCKSGSAASQVTDVEHSIWNGPVPSGFERRTTC